MIEQLVILVGSDSYMRRPEALARSAWYLRTQVPGNGREAKTIFYGTN